MIFPLSLHTEITWKCTFKEPISSSKKSLQFWDQWVQIDSWTNFRSASNTYLKMATASSPHIVALVVAGDIVNNKNHLKIHSSSKIVYAQILAKSFNQFLGLFPYIYARLIILDIYLMTPKIEKQRVNKND